MFAGQQPYPTWQQALPPADDPGRGDGGTEPDGAKANEVSSAASRPRALAIVLAVVLGLAALASLGIVGTFMLRPAEAPKTATALPPLAGAAPPLAQDASSPASQTTEPGDSGSEAGPFDAGLSPQARFEPAPAPFSTIIARPGYVPLPPMRAAAAPDDVGPLPPPRPLAFRPIARPFDFGPIAKPATGYDRWTAIYDISAHTVYLPDGARLEAHSGLAGDRDDPRFVNERDRGATPPHLYQLTLRESLFHGVQALRLTPIGEGDAFGRSGFLAHPYMLGPSGDSNGCVSFKNYDAFLRAFQDGEVKRLAVVARWTQDPGQVGRLASLQGGR
jgi:hypothetical protein